MEKYPNTEETNTYKYCLRCGRRLKSPDARERGMGKTCFAKMQTSNKDRPLFDIEKYSKDC